LQQHQRRSGCTATAQTELGFADLRQGHSTPNGLNRHFVEQFRANGGHDAVLAAFESVEKHMQKLSETKPNSSKQKGALPHKRA
jgi:hypothetical protein